MNACASASDVARAESCSNVEFVGTTGWPGGGSPQFSITVTNVNTGATVSGASCNTSNSHTCFACDKFTAVPGTTYRFTLRTTRTDQGVPSGTTYTRSVTVAPTCTRDIPAN